MMLVGTGSAAKVTLMLGKGGLKEASRFEEIVVDSDGDAIREGSGVVVYNAFGRSGTCPAC